MLIALVIGLLLIPVLLQRWVRAHERSALPRPIDLGVVLAWVACLYSALPVLGIQLASWGVGTLYDHRIGGGIPAQTDVLRVAAMYWLFILGFAVAYRARVGGARLAQPTEAQRATTGDVVAVLLILVSIKLGIFLMRHALGVQASEDYVGSYVELADQPLVVRQAYGVLAASELSASVLAIVVVLAKDMRLHRIVGLLVALQIAMAVVGGASRAQAFLCAFAYLVARSIYDPNLRLRTLMLAGVGGLTLFLVAGLMRQSVVADEALPGMYLLQGGELLSVFYNALDLQERSREVDLGLLRVGLYLVDVLRFVPQQLIGDLKLDPAAFYVATFYPDFGEAGGGLAFGTVAEATLGFGPFEALARGLLLGYLFACLRSACLQPRLSLVRAFVYTWFVVLAYQAIRDTTFSVVPRFFFQVFPLLAVIWLGGALRGSRTRRLDRTPGQQRRPRLARASFGQGDRPTAL